MEQRPAVVNGVPAATQQVAHLRAQVIELENTVDSVRNQPEDLALHPQMGGVLVEVSDRKDLLRDIGQTLTTLTEHRARFTERENQIMAT